MSTEVHIFLATATASGVERWPVGERHAMHIYLRQPPGSEHNWEAAALVAMKSGWSNVEIKKAGTLPANTADKKGEPERSCFLAALNKGDALLIYSEQSTVAHNMALNRSAVTIQFYFFSFPGRARLALRYAS